MMTSYSLDEALKTNPVLTRWFAVVGLIVLWIATRPYLGIVDDAQLYTFQAMAKLNPNNLSDDIFLKYGSQDNFTIYSHLLAVAISLVGDAKANILLTTLGAALWLTTMGFLVFTIFPVYSHRVAALWSVVILSANYGATNFYAQQYQSPRLYGEVIVIFAIALALRLMWLRALLALAIGAIVHPLMILYGFGMVFLLAAREKHILWLLPSLGLILLSILSWFQIEPFSRINFVMPTDWWNFVVSTDWADFVTRWNLANYVLIFMQINIGILFYCTATVIEQKLLQALFIVVAISLLVSLIGADWIHDLLVVNVQFYRATFLSSTLINMFSGVLFVRLSSYKGISRSYVMLSIALSIVDRYVLIEIFPVCLLLFLSSLAMWWEGKGEQVSRFWVLPLFAIAVFVAFATIIMFWLEWQIKLSQPYSWFYIVSVILVVAVFISIFTFLKSNKILACIMLIATLLFGLTNFDQRSPWEKFVESARPPPAPILALINKSENIYWESGRAYLWFSLHHISYFSYLQCVGSMFYQRTADNCEQRGVVLSQLDSSDFDNDKNNAFPKRDIDKNGPASISQLTSVCQALPELKLIVLFTKVPDSDPMVWTLPVQEYSNAVTDTGVKFFKPESHY